MKLVTAILLGRDGNIERLRWREVDAVADPPVWIGDEATVDAAEAANEVAVGNRAQARLMFNGEYVLGPRLVYKRLGAGHEGVDLDPQDARSGSARQALINQW